MSEALIFASTNPQYDDRLFTVHENCKLRIPAEHNAYTNCFFVLTFRTIYVYNMFWTLNSINNLLSNCGLVDAKIRASDKDLPVLKF